MYLKQTVTTRRVPFSFEGIESLKAIREHYNNIGMGFLPLPTIIDNLVQTKFKELTQTSPDTTPELPEYIPAKPMDLGE